MKVAFLRSFERDLKKLKKDRQMLGRIREAIKEVEPPVSYNTYRASRS